MTAFEPSMSDQPIILPRDQHNISRKLIDPDTLKVLYRLHRHGFKAYLVGGSVRDLLLGRTPKDFDVGTDATPNQVKKLFRNAFLVGRRFRLAHVRFGPDKMVEVATFRRQPGPEELPEDPADHYSFVENVFGTPAADAFRRDFSINALFYDIATFSVIDYVGGLKDLRNRRIRVIGDPLVRFTEDPVRMLRALEFAARLGFSLDEASREAIYARAALIAEAAPARLREEILELFRHRVAGEVLRQARATGLLSPLMAGFEGDEETFALLEKMVQRTAAGTPVEEPFALAALHLHRFRRACPADADLQITDVLRLANLVLTPYCNFFRIAHGTRHFARELLIGFFRLVRGRGRRGERRFLSHPMTPLALELFTIWSEATGEEQQLAFRWRQALAGEQEQQPVPPKKRRRRPRKRPPKVPSKSIEPKNGPR